ncbi:MAG: hypothetical protein HKN25_00515 [Pyrinomonadaceae bacterium]|nr:hypothetical protein [Pyrinomonadaceae bacterium]
MKKKSVEKVFISFCLLFVFTAGSSNAFASGAQIKPLSKCAMLNFEKAFERAGAIFVGEVIEIEKEAKKRIFEFKVKKYWKGSVEKTIKVAAHENPRFQAPFEKGKSFLVFAKSDEDGGYWDGRCSRTRNMESFAPSLKEDLKKLGKARMVTEETKECKEGEKEETLSSTSGR